MSSWVLIETSSLLLTNKKRLYHNIPDVRTWNIDITDDVNILCIVSQVICYARKRHKKYLQMNLLYITTKNVIVSA